MIIWERRTSQRTVSSLLRRCYPVHKYPKRRENKHSMQNIPDFLWGKHPYPHPIPQKNPYTYSSRELIWIQRQKLSPNVTPQLNSSMRTSTTWKNAFVLEVTPYNFKEKITFEVKFIEQKSALQKNNEGRKEILPLPNLKNVLMSKWHLIQDKPVLREIYNKTTIISFKRGKSLGDIRIRAKL